MAIVPHFLLKRLYLAGSLCHTDEGVSFTLKNVLGPGMLTGLARIKLDDTEYPVEQIFISHENQTFLATDISDQKPLHVLMNQTVSCLIKGVRLDAGSYKIELAVKSREAGTVTLSVNDQIT